jgi:hypothetical protein
LSLKNATVGLGLEKKYLIYTCFFFLNVGLVEPVLFGSVQSVSEFGNRNRTKPELFCDFLIG